MRALIAVGIVCCAQAIQPAPVDPLTLMLRDAQTTTVPTEVAVPGYMLTLDNVTDMEAVLVSMMRDLEPLVGETLTSEEIAARYILLYLVDLDRWPKPGEEAWAPAGRVEDFDHMANLVEEHQSRQVR